VQRVRHLLQARLALHLARARAPRAARPAGRPPSDAKALFSGGRCFRDRCHAVYRKREDADAAPGGAAPLPWLPCDFCDAWGHPACEAQHAPVRRPFAPAFRVQKKRIAAAAERMLLSRSLARAHAVYLSLSRRRRR
jgi:hypothetical protein